MPLQKMIGNVLTNSPTLFLTNVKNNSLDSIKYSSQSTSTKKIDFVFKNDFALEQFAQPLLQ
jgi:hypothetical protein